jgi:hypothetical protein
MTAYLDQSGFVKYCSSDTKRRCAVLDKTCDRNSGSMACSTPWWTAGYWYGWNPYWDVYGENLTYLYSEIEGPDWVFCGNYWYWWMSGYQDCGIHDSDCDNISNTDCGKPRIKKCKKYNCINNNNIPDCTIINGKDRETRCCKKPDGFVCQPGECDYTYTIVKKEYTVDYERVAGGGTCKDTSALYDSYPETSCYQGVTVVDSKCVTSVYGCTPPDECSPDRCVPATKDGWDPVGEEPSHDWFWLGITWEYDLIDCECNTCAICTDCTEYDCNTYGNSLLFPGGWGYWGGYYGGIGSDCCGAPPQLCPKHYGNGSNNPWWCSGTDCLQYTDAVGKASGFEGPYSSYATCIKQCGNFIEENNCIPSDYTYTRGVCCDNKFMTENRKKIDEGECLDTGPSYNETNIQSLCTDSFGCGGNAVYNYSKEMCTFVPKYCKTKKVERQRGYYNFTFSPEIPDKDYECNCIICDSDESVLESCKAQDCYMCPKGSQKPIVTLDRTVISGGGDVIEEVTVKLIVVYCKITTSECPEYKI